MTQDMLLYSSFATLVKISLIFRRYAENGLKTRPFFNAVNGNFRRIYTKVGTPLPVRGQLEGGYTTEIRSTQVLREIGKKERERKSRDSGIII